MRDGRAYPKAIADAPDLLPEHVFYYNAYMELGTCRQTDGGFIPWTAAREYADYYELSNDIFETLVRVCQLVDSGVKNAKPTKKPASAPASTPPRSNRRRRS